MRLIDTHCHLYVDEFREDGPEVISRARARGVEQFYLPNVDGASIPDLLALEEAYPGVCLPMMGLHPCYVKEDYREQLGVMRAWLDKRSFASIGEIGLDFHWDLSFRDQQVEAFQVQIEWAIQFGLPIVIHSRKSLDECIRQVRDNQDGRLGGIFHCFSGNPDQARAIVDLGFYLGIGGVLTYKNGGLEPVIRELGLDRVVLETDAPYLSPVPFRGRRNEPAYLEHIVEKLSQVSGVSPEEVAESTSTNAEKIFGKPGK